MQDKPQENQKVVFSFPMVKLMVNKDPTDFIVEFLKELEFLELLGYKDFGFVARVLRLGPWDFEKIGLVATSSFHFEEE